MKTWEKYNENYSICKAIVLVHYRMSLGVDHSIIYELENTWRFLPSSTTKVKTCGASGVGPPSHIEIHTVNEVGPAVQGTCS